MPFSGLQYCAIAKMIMRKLLRFHVIRCCCAARNALIPPRTAGGAWAECTATAEGDGHRAQSSSSAQCWICTRSVAVMCLPRHRGLSHNSVLIRGRVRWMELNTWTEQEACCMASTMGYVIVATARGTLRYNGRLQFGSHTRKSGWSHACTQKKNRKVRSIIFAQ